MIHRFTLLTSRSHAPPCQGLLSVMYFHLTPCGTKASSNSGDESNFVTSFAADLKVLALSLYSKDGRPRRAQNLRNARKNASTCKDSTYSK